MFFFLMFFCTRLQLTILFRLWMCFRNQTFAAQLFPVKVAIDESGICAPHAEQQSVSNLSERPTCLTKKINTAMDSSSCHLSLDVPDETAKLI